MPACRLPLCPLTCSPGRRQGDEPELLLEEVNNYQRAIQYQQLEKVQFGAAEPPGFYFQARPCQQSFIYRCTHHTHTHLHELFSRVSVLISSAGFCLAAWYSGEHRCTLTVCSNNAIQASTAVPLQYVATMQSIDVSVWC